MQGRSVRVGGLHGMTMKKAFVREDGKSRKFGSIDYVGCRFAVDKAAVSGSVK